MEPWLVGLQVDGKRKGEPWLVGLLVDGSGRGAGAGGAGRIGKGAGSLGVRMGCSRERWRRGGAGSGGR